MFINKNKVLTFVFFPLKVDSHSKMIELLIDAIDQNNFKICKELIKGGTDVNIYDKYGYTALMYAAVNECKEICSLLLENKADVNIKSEHSSHTALMYASSGGYKEICSLLLENEVDINMENKKGDTALTEASYWEHKEVYSLLISSGCNYSSRYKRISYNRLSIPTFRTFMIENVRNQKEIKLKKLINIVPEEILDDINNNSIEYCTKCNNHFYYYKYELKLKDLKKDEIINVKVHCL